MPIFDATSLPYPSKGQLPRADWFVTYSQALRVLAGAVESLQGGSAETGMLRLAKTVAGDESYPLLADEPNCFNIKFRKLHDYTAEPGDQTVTKANRHDDTDQDAAVLNLAALNGWNDAYYIPVDTDLWCFGLGGKWFTWYAIPTGTTVTVVTDVRVFGTALQYKTRDIAVLDAGAESAWTTFHTGTNCPSPAPTP